MPSPSLSDIPSEVVLEHLLPALPLRDLVSLSAVNRHLNALSNDPTFWRHKTLSDFTFPSALHPSTSSKSSSVTGTGWWKRVYLGLLSPSAYVWGSSQNHRLGNAHLASSGRFANFVDIPCQISWDKDSSPKSWAGHLGDSLAQVVNGPGGVARENGNGGPAGVVDLQAGGWSFSARCSDGSIWVWGQLDGPRIAFNAPSWENKHCPCPEPTRLPLPCKTEAMSAGRSHLLVLDSDNLVWESRAWGKAFHHTAPALTSPSGHGTTRHPPHIVQLSAGWDHSAALTAAGEIHIWYPFSRAYEAGLTPDDQLNGPLGANEGDDNRALRWGTVGNDVVHTLPPVPVRPEYEATDTDSSEVAAARGPRKRAALEAEWKEYESTRSPNSIEEEQRIVKIAGGEDFLVALKKNGEVWLTRVKESEPPVWQYLPYFSSPSITHLTAQFQSLTTYATPTASSASPTSSVCHARLPAISTSSLESLVPDDLPDLQNRGVIQVAIGDYHYAALTDKGQMLTWGQGNSGQLGRGPDRSGDKPTVVDFDYGAEEEGEKDNFVFAITAGGWHTGALVLGRPGRDDKLTNATWSGSLRNDATSSSGPSDADAGSGGYGRMPGGFPGPTGDHGHGYGRARDPPSLDFGAYGVRAMPFFRVGFAGRGGNVARGRGGSQGGQGSNREDDSGRGGRGRGIPSFRAGFAGRGGPAGGRGGHGTTQGNGVGFNDDGPE